MNKSDFSIGKILGISFAVLFFWIFVFNIWFSNTIFNRDNFVNTTTQVLTSESSRNAISAEVVELTQESFPIIGTAAAPLIEKVVGGVLATDLFTNIFTKLSEEIYYQLTTESPKPLELAIGQVLNLIKPFLDDQNSELFDQIPSKVTIIGANEIPSLYNFSQVLAILGPLSLIAGLAIVGLLWMRILDKRHYFIIIGLAVATSGFLVFSLIPILGNFITSGISSANGIFIINELYNAFTKNLVDFSLLVLILGLLTAFVAKFVKRDLFKLPDRSSKSK